MVFGVFVVVTGNAHPTPLPYAVSELLLLFHQCSDALALHCTSLLMDEHKGAYRRDYLFTPFACLNVFILYSIGITCYMPIIYAILLYANYGTENSFPFRERCGK